MDKKEEKKIIRQEFLTGERALFMGKNLDIYDTIFDDGESPLKESRGINLYGSMFKWKYQLWYSKNIVAEDCHWFEMARAGVWYTDNIAVRRALIHIVILYLATVLNRMRFAFFNVSKSVKQRVVRQSMIALAVYFVLTVSVVCAESVIPSFSLGTAFSESASYTREVRAGGLFVEKPYVPICLGFLYYSVLSFFNFKTVWRERAFIKRRCTGGYTEEVTNKRQQKNK